MVILFNGSASKVVLIRPLDLDWMLAVYVFKSVHLHILLSFQPEIAFKIVVEDFMEIQSQEHAKTVPLNAQHAFLHQIVSLVFLQNIYLTENVLISAY